MCTVCMDVLYLSTVYCLVTACACMHRTQAKMRVLQQCTVPTNSTVDMCRDSSWGRDKPGVVVENGVRYMSHTLTIMRQDSMMLQM